MTAEIITTGTILIIAGAACIVVGVILWIVFAFSTRKRCRKKIVALANEYSCKD